MSVDVLALWQECFYDSQKQHSAALNALNNQRQITEKAYGELLQCEHGLKQRMAALDAAVEKYTTLRGLFEAENQPPAYIPQLVRLGEARQAIETEIAAWTQK